MTSISLPELAIIKGDGPPHNQILTQYPLFMSGEGQLACEILKILIRANGGYPDKLQVAVMVDTAFQFAEMFYKNAVHQGHTVKAPPISEILPKDKPSKAGFFRDGKIID